MCIVYIQIEFSSNQKDNRRCATSQQQVFVLDVRLLIAANSHFRPHTQLNEIHIPLSLVWVLLNISMCSVSSVSTVFHNNFQFFVSFSLAVMHTNSMVLNTLRRISVDGILCIFH